MNLAIGFYDGYSWRIETTSCDPQVVARELFEAFTDGCGHHPESILIIKSSITTQKYFSGKDYS